jgi:hypothetical protein
VFIIGVNLLVQITAKIADSSKLSRIINSM